MKFVLYSKLGLNRIQPELKSILQIIRFYLNGF